MHHRTFKQCLEPYVGVSVEHFKIYKSFKYSDLEFSTMSDSLNICKENEKITVKLERTLKKGEYLGNVFLLTPNIDEVNFY